MGQADSKWILVVCRDVSGRQTTEYYVEDANVRWTVNGYSVCVPMCLADGLLNVMWKMWVRQTVY